MESFINELKKNKILSRDDITRIRDDIKRIVPYADDKHRASLLSRALYRTIDRNLDEFSEKYKQKIKKSLIKTFIYENRNCIKKSDVFFTCTNFENKTEELIENLTIWVNNNVESIVNREIMNGYLAFTSDIPLQNYNTNHTQKNVKILREALFDEGLENNNYRFTYYYDFIKSKILKYTSIINNKKKSRIYVVINVVILLLIIAIGKNIHFNKNVINEVSGKDYSLEINIEENNLIDKRDMIKLSSIYDSLEDSYHTQYSTVEYFQHIPDFLRYKNINQQKLRNYLISRNSILAEEPYFTTVINAAKEFSINPIILFAITGQEQSFVPKSHKKAKVIANNPFNVFGSWQKYNTNIKDSSEVAARTVFNLLKNRPEGVDPFKWVNRKYAEDKNWYIGVSRLFNQIEAAVN